MEKSIDLTHLIRLLSDTRTSRRKKKEHQQISKSELDRLFNNGTIYSGPVLYYIDKDKK